MTISFLLNGKEVSANTPPERRLVDLLRDEFGLTGCRAGCYQGDCGICSIFFNGEISYSCLVPAFAVQGSEVTTFEGLADTQEMKDVLEGFAETGCTPCPSCRQSKYLSVYGLLETNPVPESVEIHAAFESHRCRCIDISVVQRAVVAATNLRRFRRSAAH